jgi:hypothetical protein
MYATQFGLVAYAVVSTWQEYLFGAVVCQSLPRTEPVEMRLEHAVEKGAMR